MGSGGCGDGVGIEKSVSLGFDQILKNLKNDNSLFFAYYNATGPTDEWFLRKQMHELVTYYHHH